VTFCVRDLASPKATCSVLPVRYDENHSWTESETPIVEIRRWRRMLWSTVLNAAVKSRRIRRVGEPASAVIGRSFVTLTRAVSVLWPGRNPD